MTAELDGLKKETAALFPDKRLVFGCGNTGALLMLIGEAPGENEEKQGIPFVGKAGKNLDELLALSGIRREEIYITNAVKFRPTTTGKSGRNINRKPTNDEISAFRPFLIREIETVRPLIVATLGNVPLEAVTGKSIKIGDAHGKIMEMSGFKLYPMYHPASVIYNPALKQIYINDVCRLGELIKQYD